MKKIGIISSAGGSVIFALRPFLLENGFDIVVVTDRECESERKCGILNIPYKRFNYDDQFSNNASMYLKDKGVTDLVFLFFTRFVHEHIFNAFTTINIHPSLLPAFKGLNPLKQMEASGVTLMGATGHLVDESCDGGKILAQIANAYHPSQNDKNKLSFLQKIYVTLSIFDQYLSNDDGYSFTSNITPIQFINANPGFNLSSSLNFFNKIQKEEGIQIIAQRELP